MKYKTLRKSKTWLADSSGQFSISIELAYNAAFLNHVGNANLLQHKVVRYRSVLFLGSRSWLLYGVCQARPKYGLYRKSAFSRRWAVIRRTSCRHNALQMPITQLYSLTGSVRLTLLGSAAAAAAAQVVNVSVSS